MHQSLRDFHGLSAMRHVHPESWWRWYSKFICASVSDAYRTQWEHRTRWMMEPIIDQLQGARVVDLASGLGQFGVAALAAGADHVRLFDIRPQHCVDYESATGDGALSSCEFLLGSMESSEELAYACRDRDVIIYAGHWYHTSRHMQILEDLVATSAHTILIESVVLQGDLAHQHEQHMTWHRDVWDNPLTEPWQAAQQPPGGFAWVGHPTANWTLAALASLGYPNCESSVYMMPTGDLRYWVLVRRDT